MAEIGLLVRTERYFSVGGCHIFSVNFTDMSCVILT